MSKVFFSVLDCDTVLFYVAAGLVFNLSQETNDFI